jgi:hypothetical protein
LGGLLSFVGQADVGLADGGDAPTDAPFWTGERGPELVVPKGRALNVIPNHMIKGFADGAGLADYNLANTTNNGGNHFEFHAHGMTNPDQFIRYVGQKLPQVLKNSNPKYSPYAR